MVLDIRVSFKDNMKEKVFYFLNICEMPVLYKKERIIPSIGEPLKHESMWCYYSSEKICFF